ncbi:MAG: hypothetical protein ACYTDX_03565, partial [Planctomycetota bacterium]
MGTLGYRDRMPENTTETHRFPLSAALLTMAIVAPGAAGALSQDTPVPGSPTIQDFDGKDEGTPFVLTKKGADPAPKVERGRLLLLNGGRSRGPLSNAAA